MPHSILTNALRIDQHESLAGLVAISAEPLELWADQSFVRLINPSPATGAFDTPVDWPAKETLSQTVVLRRAGEVEAFAIGHLDRLSPGSGWSLTDVTGEMGRFVGGIDQVVGPTLIGWAHDRLSPDNPVVVDIMVNGQHARSTVADRLRVDPVTGAASRNGFMLTLDDVRGSVLVEAGVAAGEAPFFATVLGLGGRSFPKQIGSYELWLDEHDVSRPVAVRRAQLFGQERTCSAAVLVLPPFAGTPKPERETVDWHRTLQSIEAQVLAPVAVLQVGGPAFSGSVIPTAACKTWLEALKRVEDCEYVLVVEAGDTLAPAALLLLQEALDGAPDAPFAFADEDRAMSNLDPRRAPVFKTKWDADLAGTQQFQFRPALVRTSLLSPRSACASPSDYFGCLRDIAEGAPAHPAHAPFVLLHRQGMDDFEAVVSGGSERCATARTQTWPLVSVVIPTRDMLPLLAQSVEGVLYETDYPAIELVLADNDSREPETLRFLDNIRHDPRVRIVPFAGPFDYSAINNLAVSRSQGELIALLNNDIKVIGSDWLKLMVQEAQRPDVGAVGARLLYGDGRIQHAGIALGIGGVASHLNKREPGDSAGANGRLRHVHQVSAITAACLLVRRVIWDEVGGLSTEFPIAFNDVDFCLKLQVRGYRNLMQPAACLFHLESASRGREDTPEKKARFAADKQRMLDHWGPLIEADPFVSPNWSLASTSIVPAFPPRCLPIFDQPPLDQIEAINRQ